jgi:hypothetical protein
VARLAKVAAGVEVLLARCHVNACLQSRQVKLVSADIETAPCYTCLGRLVVGETLHIGLRQPAMRHNDMGGTRGRLAQTRPDRRHAARGWDNDGVTVDRALPPRKLTASGFAVAKVGPTTAATWA